MAIVEMKHVDMLAMESDRPALLTAIQQLGCLQLTPADAEDVTFNRTAPAEEAAKTEELLKRLAWAIGRLNRFDTEKKPFMADKPTIDGAQAQTVLAEQPALLRTVEELEALEREAGDLRGQTARVTAQREQLLPWKDFPLPPSEVHGTRNTVAILGSLQKAALDQWQSEGLADGLVYVEPVSTQRDLVFVYVVYHRAVLEDAQRLLKDAGFTPVSLPQSSHTAAEQLQALDQTQSGIDGRQKNIVERTAALAIDLKAIKQLYDILDSRLARLAAMQQLSRSERTFFMQGWVPAPMIPAVEEKLHAAAATVALRFYDAQEGEEPPVLLQNNPRVTPFETVVSSFSLPSPGGIDPSAVMTPFFINFMGMMVSDAGYGLMMAILAPILIKLLKPAKSTRKLLWIIFGGGVMTVFWGAMYNSWFGYAPFPSLLDPMNNALPVMGLCIGLGALHLFAGLGMAAYLNIRRGQYLDMIFDQLSWFMLVVGLVLMLFAPAVGKWLALAGAGIIVVMAGRAKSKNPIKRLISGFGALYGITGWVSDLLSYIRLFGMGLATGVIGMVINILVGMVAGGGGIISFVLAAAVFVGGHLFNAGINIFGAYVHSCRLQYIEFFGKFYEDGGKPFTPLAERSSYVYIRDA
jgi:V/A-type H+-transporting ATPase subunit I